ncbi:hypothetical protein ACEWY4_027656 [Coilia grayii]|uniref:RFX1 transcription activation region domain-containing protein n=1 Tax=Coilia grayii TaxID=363190 RepID=A0ABD1IP27_9TELE
MQKTSVLQTTAQAAKTEQGTQLTVTSLQPVHIAQELQQVPVQHVYTNQVQYVEAGDPCYTLAPCDRSGSFTYSETPLYTQPSAGSSYYEATPTSSSPTTPATPLTVAVTTGSAGSVSMFVAGAGQIVANPVVTSGSGGGATVAVATGTAGAANGTGKAGPLTGGRGL